jgi:acyl-CoA reductase-like NAD-dependent aldehyde dehydrogenase
MNAQAPIVAAPELLPAIERLERTFRSGRTRDLAWRAAQLEGIARFVREQEAAILAALKADLGKGLAEALTAEVLVLAKDADYARKRLKRWAAPERVATPLTAKPGKSRVVREPYGVCLIIGAWNFPFQLTLLPLIAALAAGNAAVLKPSELAPHSSRLLAEKLGDYVDPDAVLVAEGGVEETTALLRRRWGFIFYTGNGRVARIVARAAAETLTPVALELGGKSPAVVLADADLDVAARRIVWGRMMNAGQVCTAPDYVLVDQRVERQLLERLSGTIGTFFGDDPSQSPDFGRIVNRRHVERLQGLIASGLPVTGGEADPDARYVAPTILTGVTADSAVMQEEIFGPVLPVLPVGGLDEAIAFIAERDPPLAAYIFSGDASARASFIERTKAGGVVGNDVIMHMTVPELPFGGVGESGQGAYHGRWGFDLFSHKKAVLDRGTRFDLKMRYPPYTSGAIRTMRRLV